MSRRFAVVGALPLAATSLTGCSSGKADGGFVGTNSESPAPASTQPSEPAAPALTETPSVGQPSTPEPKPAPLSAPACEDIATLGWLQENLHEEIEGPDHFDFDGAGLPGPAARRAVAESDVLAACTWGIPYSDGVFYVAVIAVEEEVRTGLVSALESSPKYTNRADGYVNAEGETAATFSHVYESDNGYGLAYALSSGYWIISSGTMISPDDATRLTGMALEAAAV